MQHRPYGFDIYVKTISMAQIFLAFSEKLNFTSETIKTDVRTYDSNFYFFNNPRFLSDIHTGLAELGGEDKGDKSI